MLEECRALLVSSGFGHGAVSRTAFLPLVSFLMLSHDLLPELSQWRPAELRILFGDLLDEFCALGLISVGLSLLGRFTSAS